jgi:AcrR family transcriptional regulator
MASTDTTALSTRDALLAAGRRAFADRGYVGSSLTRIARDAGLTTGAFYRHFTSKAELSQVLFASYREDLERALARGRSLRGQVEAWLLVAREHRGAVRVAQELLLVDAAQAVSQRELRSAAAELMERHLDEAIAPRERDLAAYMVADVVTQYVVMEAAGWVPERDAKAVSVELARLMTKGLYSR